MHGPTASDGQHTPRILGLAAGLLTLISATPTAAQLPNPDGAQRPGGMARTWSQFQSAVQADDPEAMARISRFPVQSNEFGGPISDVTQLRQRFGLIFSASRRPCLLNQTPRPLRVDGRELYEAFCDTDRYPIRFLFERVSSEYRWTAIDNINE
jgi:hypothetical protein